MSKKFKTQDYFRYKKLGTKWRKAKGSQSKLRKRKAGSGLIPRVGYGTKNSEKGKVNSLVPVVVRNENDLKGLGKEHGIILASALGVKKMSGLVKKIEEMNLLILNKRKLKKIKKTEEKIKSHKKIKEKKASEKAKEEKAKEAEKKKTEEKAKEAVKSEARQEEKPDKKKLQEANQPGKAEKSGGEKEQASEEKGKENQPEEKAAVKKESKKGEK